ncbi:MAG: DUF2723 domain-containing protein [Chloroflexi bacterium]|nr:DUF2723 domain-containing protein [Chloroflexota bacterium]
MSNFGGSWNDSRVEWAVFAVVASIALVVYAVTLAPGITWENLGGDGGDLLTAAFTWGIPHPSGYPTYLLGLRGFAAVFPFGDEAFRANVFSALLAALSVGFVFLASLRLMELVPHLAAARRWTILASAAFAGVAVAVSRELWSQATITEVYALNALFVSSLIYGLLVLYGRHVRGEPEGRLRVVLALLLGVGLGNHLTLAVFAAPFIVWSYSWGGDRSAVLGRLRDWRTPAAFLAGLAVYLYAPIASAGAPVLNWGHPDNADGFWWMVSGSIYQEYQFGVDSSQILDRIAGVGDLILSQYAFVGLVLSFVGLSVVWESHRGFVISGLAGMVLVTGYAIGYDTVDSFLYLIPVFMLMGVWMGVGALALLLAVGEAVPRVFGVVGVGAHSRALVQVAAIAVLLGAVPGFSAFANFDGLNLSDDRRAIDFAEGAIAQAEPGSVIVTSGAVPVFSLWYQSYVVEPEAGVLALSMGHLQFDWYWDDVRRQAPDVLPEVKPDEFLNRIRVAIDFNLGVRPVYVAGEIGFFEKEYTLEPAGEIYRVLP